VSRLVVIEDETETALAEDACCLSDWAPDGLQVAFSAGVDLNSELYVIGADGTGLRRLTVHGASDVLPRWSPDGARIAFASDRGTSLRMPIAELDLWILDVASGATRALTQGFGDVLGHSWSRDGENIVFSRADVDNQPGGDLWVIEVDTGDVALMAEGDFAWPEWSPGGDTIAAVTHRDGEPFVVLLDARTRHSVDLTHGDLPRWTPDGRSLLVTRANSIVKVDTLNGVEAIITDGCCASIAPDGHRIVVNVES
jgi:Tol biopolymer transport system component